MSLAGWWIKKMWSIGTMEYSSALKKKETLVTCGNKDYSGGLYAKWNKPVAERQILYDFTYMIDLK